MEGVFRFEEDDEDENIDRELYKLWLSLEDRPASYMISIDGNISGGLSTPDGRMVFHKGLDADDGERESLKDRALRRSKKLAEKGG